MVNTAYETFGTINLSAFSARTWAREGFTSAQAHACINLGLSPQNARERINLLTPERRTQLGLGF